ncbi:hypothetical protein NCCP1664_20280 [Zafaria cholistanensis]|uniref:DUF3710 domain-containing protein n=1 Tax=Zafaria cholistanensis TaxID=1682741 RepID=A0A5A7NRQ5_9MICC|nr:DUF3710 domain-containing protein [Zafaria cholistanensis]GER23533.1 hypothetical protein NCCP1664_20280 [Zafaria cholistanensis]
MIFKRRKSTVPAADAAVENPAAEAARTPQGEGPYDADDVPDRAGYVDLGALLVEPVEGMQLRLEVEDRSQRVIAVALELDGSRLQLQVFAASKSEDLWPGISTQIANSIAEQGGKTERVAGRFGEELIARVPSQAPDGTTGYMVARFIGIDGPRWFLRGVVGGPAVLDPAAARRLEDCIARLVVVRGDKPMPPAELLPLTVPSGAVARREEPVDPPAAPERGPEISEIG